MHCRRLLHLSAWLSGLALTCAVQAGPHPLSFSPVPSEGADSRAILAMVQDRQGFVWIGTIEGGLFRNDGHRQLRYLNDPADPHSLPGGRVAALFLDEVGRLWVGTDEGLARYDTESNSFVRYLPDTPASNARIVRRIVSDNRDGLWVATWGGLQHFQPRSGKFELYLHDEARPDSLAHNDINAVAVDNQGGVWAGTWPAGLDYLPPGAHAFQHLRVDDDRHPDPKLNDVRALYFDSAGTLWIGSAAGLVTWDSRQPWSARVRQAVDARRVTDLDEDRNGDMWISTRTAGLLRWDRETRQFQSYRHRPEDAHSLSSDAINTTMRDRSGSLWVGSLTDGISRANLGYHGFERFVPRDIDPDWVRSSNFVRSLSAAGNQLWLGLDDGLALFDPATRKLVRTHQAKPGQPGSLSSNVIYSMYQAPQGTLWIGTSSGLNRLDQPDGAFQVVHFGSSTADFVNTIAPGQGGVLWLGTGASLVRYDPASGAQQTFVHADQDPHSRSVNAATAVLEDRAGRVWTGEFFRGGGLDMRDPASGQFRHFLLQADNPASLSSDRVSCLHLDVDNNLWVGTSKGLNRIRAGQDGVLRVTRIQPKGALGNSLIEAIRSDKNGMLWITTATGLSKYDPVSDSVTEFSPEDGLTEGFYMDASTTTADGKFYFGSNGGISAVNPAIHSSASRPPQMAITDISLFNRSLGAGALPDGVQLEGPLTEPRALTLPWNANTLSLEFAVLHFAEPGRNGYRYLLEGFDQQWIRADASHPVASYTNLAPGKYRFRLQGSNNKGVPARDEVVLPITILPPLWQTGWARGAAALGLLAVLFGLWRWSVHRLAARNRQLERQLAGQAATLKELQHKLANLSASDSLTGLANRRCFEDVLEREWRRAARDHKPLAVALLELDQFRPYAERIGQDGADDTLRQVAQALNATVQRAGDLVARYGAAQFAFLAPATSGDDALRMAHRMAAAVARLALPGGGLTLSVGVAANVAGQDCCAEDVMLAADQALYRAKAEGGKRSILAEEAVAA